MKKAGTFAVTIVAVASSLLGPFCSETTAQTEYTSQDSATTKEHSGIVTNKGVVWDTDFAKMVTNAIGAANYSEIAFAFMQCFSGGMIDELLGANLKTAAYTAAALSDGKKMNQPSWAFPPGLIVTPQNVAMSQSTYNLPWAQSAGGKVNFTMQQAAVVGRNNDATGPVLKSGVKAYPNGFLIGGKTYPVIENPQYTSSGAAGDSITLHQPNPNNPVNAPKYLAVLFGGTTNVIKYPGDLTDLIVNKNTLTTIQDALTARGYVAAEEQIINPGGTAADLKKAWDTVKANTTPSTQVFYWNDWGHGTLGVDIKGKIKPLLGANGVPTRGITYAFDLDSDFVSDVLAHAAYVQSLGDTDPLDAPYLEVQTMQPISNVSLMLNGRSLTSLGTLDLFGDGSEFDYDFALGPADLQLLGTLDTVSLNWTGPDDPSFGLWPINLGNLADFSAGAFISVVPEPGTGLMVVSLLGLVGLVRRRVSAARA